VTSKRKGPANPYDAYRAEAYANVANRNGGRIGDLDDVIDEVMTLTPSVTVNAANYAAARLAVEAEDSARTNPPPWQYQPRLPGWPDGEDQFWRVGDGQRVRVGDATAADHVEHLKLIEENERVIVNAARAVRRSYYDLEPYYRAGAGTVSDAVLRWQRDHPHGPSGD
jgi:hypothetical protein